MTKIGKWIGSEKPEQGPEIQPHVQEALRQIEEKPPASSLSTKVAHDALQIMTKLECYCDELRAEEARVYQELEEIRADLEEAKEVIQAMRPAIDVVNKMCSRVNGVKDIPETEKEVRVLKNAAQ